jgi:filamentous hemagglutinin family protein
MSIYLPRFKPPAVVSSQAITAAASVLALGATAPAALAQLTPDATLGNENSVINNGAIVGGEVTDLIEGGAARGSNLFHSFEQFNIAAGQRVYFANPLDIQNILSRVTGGDPSNLFGTLGVDGPANLFFMNPNGIVFGPDATLDIPGSFHATTADAIPLGDAGFFSATAPEQSTLLTVDPSVAFTNYLTADSGDITSQGQLAANGDLTLAAHTLDLVGQVVAGGDLTLLGLDTVKIRDAIADAISLALPGVIFWCRAMSKLISWH